MCKALIVHRSFIQQKIDFIIRNSKWHYHNILSNRYFRELIRFPLKQWHFFLLISGGIHVSWDIITVPLVRIVWYFLSPPVKYIWIPLSNDKVHSVFCSIFAWDNFGVLSADDSWGKFESQLKVPFKLCQARIRHCLKDDWTLEIILSTKVETYCD